MASLNPPVCDFGWKAPEFSLPSPVDSKTYSLGDLRGVRGLLVAFICNHCPYVNAIGQKFAEQGKILQDIGFGVVAINSNDAQAYPEDAPEKMVEFAAQYGFSFPYLYDEDQQVARAFGAVCTPDFFGFNAMLALQYRGRFDASGRHGADHAGNELLDAMKRIALTGHGPKDQTASIGCSIKWKAK